MLEADQMQRHHDHLIKINKTDKGNVAFHRESQLFFFKSTLMGRSNDLCIYLRNILIVCN